MITLKFDNSGNYSDWREETCSQSLDHRASLPLYTFLRELFYWHHASVLSWSVSSSLCQNNHCLYCHVNVDIWTALVHKGELGIVMIKVPSSWLKSSPDCKHLNCPGLQRGVGHEDGSSLPSMQSVEPSQCLGVIMMMMMMMIMKDELWSLVDEQYVAMFKLDNIRNTVKLEW